MSETTRIPKTARERGRIAPRKFAHCVLRTRQLAEMKRWYQTVLEAEIVHENPMLAFMTYDDEHHRIAILAMPHLIARPDHAVGLDHIAFTYANFGDLIATYERLKGEGITPAVTIHHGPTLSFYYLDPDKNQVELQIDVFASLEETEAFLHSGAFQRNPIGVLFDADELARRHREGAPEAELIRPREGPPPDLSAFPSH